jgi:hypothetical protein
MGAQGREDEDARDGEHPDGEHPDGEHPDGEHPDGEHPDGEHPDGEHPDDADTAFEAARQMVIAIEPARGKVESAQVLAIRTALERAAAEYAEPAGRAVPSSNASARAAGRMAALYAHPPRSRSRVATKPTPNAGWRRPSRSRATMISAPRSRQRGDRTSGFVR